MRRIVIFQHLKNRKKERELVISEEQSSMYLMLAASLICESDYSVIKQLMNERVGNLLSNVTKKVLIITWCNCGKCFFALVTVVE
jgi:hypothetical protein